MMNTQEERDLLVAQTMYNLMALSTEYRQRVFGVIHPVEIFETYTLAHIRRKIGKQAKPHISVNDVIETIDEVMRIIGDLNHNGSISVKLLRKELKVLKGGAE